MTRPRCRPSLFPARPLQWRASATGGRCRRPMIPEEHLTPIKTRGIKPVRSFFNVYCSSTRCCIISEEINNQQVCTQWAICTVTFGPVRVHQTETFLKWHHHGMIWRSSADLSITEPSACTVQYKIKAYKSHTCQSHVSWQEVLKNKLWFGRRREPGASDHQALILKNAPLRLHQLLLSTTTFYGQLKTII